MLSIYQLAAFAALTAALPHGHINSPMHAGLELGLSSIAGRSDAQALSPVGVCGGDSGFTCGEGFCCSQYGYCGQSTDYCGVGCQFGACDASTGASSGSTGNSTDAQLSSPTAGSEHIATSVVLNVVQVTDIHTVTAGRPVPTWSSPAEIPTTQAPAPPTTLTTAYSAPASSSVVPTTSPTQAPAPSSVYPSPSSSSPAPTSNGPQSPASGKGDTYTMYNGDGEPDQGWPTEDDWVDFDSMWEANMQYISISCINSFNVPNNSDDESADLKSAIQSVASATGVDERFVLAVVMQESKGCVRAPTTSYSVRNPGLMQSHDGTGTCNDSGNVQNPCPQSEITQMINDGTAGVQGAYGLEQNLQQTGATDVSQFYKAARIYNSGSIPSSGDLGAPGATRCYASDIANRLTGWVTAPHGCTLS